LLKFPPQFPDSRIVDPRRLSPVARFSVLSLILLAGLGAVVGNLLAERIGDRALEQAVRAAQIVGAVGVRGAVPEHELGHGLTNATMRRADTQIFPLLRQAGVLKIKVFNRRRVMVYSSDHIGLGTAAPARSNVARALTGGRVQRMGHGTDDDGTGVETLEMYLPLYYGVQGRAAGAFEVYVDYSATSASVRRDVRTMWLLLAGGLFLVWALLFRLVRGVSTALRRQVSENRFLARHDALTGLPNRTVLYEELGRSVDAFRRVAVRSALLLVDLDRFKEVNDTLGHDYGDELLVEVAKRLRVLAGEDDLVVRLGGDEFAILRPSVGAGENVRELAETIVGGLRKPIDLGGTAVVVDASVGVAMCPEHGQSAVTLLRRADVAMYEAKDRRSAVEAYDPTRDKHHRNRLALLGELPRAMREDELRLAYQPKVSFADGSVHGVEALVRWQHPEQGLIMPASFVPAAELTSLVRPLTLHVLERALRDQRSWAEHGVRLQVAVNLAGPSVYDSGLPSAVEELLARYGASPADLTLEISERTALSDAARGMDVLADLRRLGVRLSLDDFGTGQTALSHLLRLPLDELKIDRSFITPLDHADDEAALVGSIVEIGRRTGLTVVAEGIETEEACRRVAELGCHVGQGYLFARPMWADALVPWVIGHAGCDLVKVA
jgi:diguanylate cyclase (GGDEF)-like protein